MSTEVAGQVGDEVTVDRCCLPDDWPAEGTVVEIGDQSVVVELSNGTRQEVLSDQITWSAAEVPNSATCTGPRPVGTTTTPVLVIKPRRDVDAYVLMSPTTGQPVFVGTRDETAAELEAAWRRQYNTLPDPDHTPAARLTRADTDGTSAMWPPQPRAYGWRFQTFIWRDPAGTRHQVPRADFADYTRRLLLQGRQ